MLLCFIKVHLCSPNEEFLGERCSDSAEARMIPMVPVFNGSELLLHDSYEGPAASWCFAGTPRAPERALGNLGLTLHHWYWGPGLRDGGRDRSRGSRSPMKSKTAPGVGAFPGS